MEKKRTPDEMRTPERGVRTGHAPMVFTKRAVRKRIKRNAQRRKRGKGSRNIPTEI